METIFNRVIDLIRAEALSKSDAGGKFELLIARWLKTARDYFAEEVADVWLWSDFPWREQISKHDTGIDIVVRTRFGEFWAVQCKCYAEATTVDKSDVDTFLATSGKVFAVDGAQTRFSRRILIATTRKFTQTAQESLENQEPPVTRIGLEELRESAVDWEKLLLGSEGDAARRQKYAPREHQAEAIRAASAYFKQRDGKHDRGKLIMACGTGKTFTSLRIAEKLMKGVEAPFLLFLVPSIALLGQSLREWNAQAVAPLHAVCVCSDEKVSRLDEDAATSSLIDLPAPATTNAKRIFDNITAARTAQKRDGGLVVVFSTYQSTAAVQKAQEQLEAYGAKTAFDLIICDEAHRTTGAVKSADERTDFMRVHDNSAIRGALHMYMTATPRVYNPAAVEKAKEKAKDLYLCDMNDPDTYGGEIYRIGFATAVAKGLLSDYKVVVLTVGRNQLMTVEDGPVFTSIEVDGKKYKNPFDEPIPDVMLKIKGCINALSKQTTESAIFTAQDPGLMRSAVAFCRNIVQSKATAQLFNAVSEHFDKTLDGDRLRATVSLRASHVDGTMSAPVRNDFLRWLKSADTSEDSRECHLLTNVRCLSEGVDVPSLDAILFLSRRKNQIEVVQSVGRVMRRAPGKKYGYIIIPVIVNDSISADAAVKDSPDFSTAWSVINALRSHDERLDAVVNALNMRLQEKKPKPKPPKPDKTKPDPIDPPPPSDPPIDTGPIIIDPNDIQQTFSLDEFKQEIYSTIVLKCGDRKYWEHWAYDVAALSKKHIDQIRRVVRTDDEVKAAFADFVKALRLNINDGITDEEAVSLISQHYVTRPVFDALFGKTQFAALNPVSQAMTEMVKVIERHTEEIDGLRENLSAFYSSIKMRIAQDVKNSYAARQDVIRELYDKFFKGAFPLTVEKLGIVYTPVEVVDFILKSCDDVLRKHFGQTLQSSGVHIEDPFTGTGTFITRLLHRFTDPDALVWKYSNEIWANEIVLLAYYIAAVNIENEYARMVERLGRKTEYLPFPGICFADTFEASEENDEKRTKGEKINWLSGFAENYERLERQQETPLTVIVGNPPYSVGQKSANDNAANTKYSHLDARIAETYAAGTGAGLKKGLYDSYIKAFRWASDRLEGKNGVIGFVTNAGWLSGNGMNGMRKCIEREFSEAYIFNLRGDQRTMGERSKKEGGKIFGSGSRAPIAVTILVKDASKAGKAAIHYVEADDYLNREQKLDFTKKTASVLSPAYAERERLITPDGHGDWLAQRSGKFGDYFALGDKKDKGGEKYTFFEPMYSLGVSTNRDAWCYNASKSELERNIRRSIEFYNGEVERCAEIFKKNPKTDPSTVVKNDSSQFSWVRESRHDLANNKKYDYSHGELREALYRPFYKQNLYFSQEMSSYIGQMPQLFPTPESENLVICIPGVGNKKAFSCLMFDRVSCLDAIEKGQCFPRYIYPAPKAGEQLGLDLEEGSRRKVDGITDAILDRARKKYGDVTKDDIFYYVYGILHSREYAQKFAADLTMMLPRLPLVNDRGLFMQFARAGRKLAALHLNYETQPPLECLKVVGNTDDCTVTKMRWAKRGDEVDKTTVIISEKLKITGIPAEAERYIVNGRSPVGWLIDQYQVTTDKASGIRNDPNDWGREHGDPQYILRLLQSVITVAVKTMEIVDALPPVDWENE